uniref:Uncharacterized protein n=1 Tax=Mola mola TaxID=94237 RepID=A0A3Q3X6K4_MOLML
MALTGDTRAQSGRRIGQKYGNKVLLGNFTREPKTANSTDCLDYRPHRDLEPGVFERRSALLRAEGLPSKLPFAHHGPRSSHYLVTHYTESYGSKHTNALPTVRPWHGDSLTWQLEREKQQSHLPSLTVYRSAYQKHPLGTFCQSRFARASRLLSGHLHASNHNKDL